MFYGGKMDSLAVGSDCMEGGRAFVMGLGVYSLGCYVVYARRITLNLVQP